METFILKDISLSGWAFGDSNDVLDILAGDNWILNDFFAIWKEVSYLNNIRIVCFWEHDWYLVTSLFVFLILCIVFFEDLSIFGIVYFWGPTVRGPICHFWGADSWAPDNWAPGPNCPGPNLPRTIGPRTTGPRGPTVRGPICHFFRADSWAPDNWAPSPFGICNDIFDDLWILFGINDGISMFGMVYILFWMSHLGLGWQRTEVLYYWDQIPFLTFSGRVSRVAKSSTYIML